MIGQVSERMLVIVDGGGPVIERRSVAEAHMLSMNTDSVGQTLRLTTTTAPTTFVVEVYRVRLRVCLRTEL